ncbi:MAG: iron chelate uptake ABC transporter family permease subunit, partial [Bacteroidota bacterium]
MEFFSLIQEEWVIRALIASCVVGLMCGMLGAFVVLRNMAMIGDALSHSILPGVVFAFMLVGHSTLGFFTGSVIAGLITAIGITWIQQQGFTKNDAAIGIVFTAMFSIGVMAISAINRRPGVHLDLVDFLFGDVLGVSNEDLWLTGGVAIYVVISILLFYRYLFVTTFQPVIAKTMGISVQMVHYFVMLLLSFVVVAALRTVGVILVVAMLITPAATALLLADRLPRVLTLSGILGVLSAFLGLVFSIEFDTTPGPAMAIVAAGFYLLALFFSPRRGVLTRYRQRAQIKRRILLEDTLKEAYRLNQKNTLEQALLAQKLNLSNRRLQPLLTSLRKRKWMEPDELLLTPAGEDKARKMVRAHRLWESYLVSHVGLSAEQIHEEAEHYEHFLDEE